MANYDNIKDHGFDKLTAEERREIAQKAGRKSGEVRREKADLKKQMQLWLGTEVSRDANGNTLTGAEYMVQIAVREMRNGNPKFWELIRDTAGQKPIDKIQIAEIDADIMEEVDNLVNQAEVEDANEKTGD